MNLKSTGQKEPLQKGSPLNVLPENHSKPDLQAIGDKAPLKMEPSTVKYGANTPHGTMQLIGDSQKLSKTPMISIGKHSNE